MVKKEQADILRQGALTWNIWREHQEHTLIDLSRADLSKINLSRANLSEADLSNVDFTRTNLSHADFIGSNLRHANLSYADLTGAYLNGANLTGANLSDVYLSRAYLTEANLTRSNLNSTNLDNANISKAIVGWTTFGDIDFRTTKGLETVQHLGPSYISTSTLERSDNNIPEIFLKSAGISDDFIKFIQSQLTRSTIYPTCFISYSSKDELFARQIYKDLQREGIRCWFAPEDMNIGDKIRPRIEESIKRYDKLLLILSKHSIASNWVAYEVERALDKELKDKPSVLYPVRVDKTILTCRKQWAKDIKETRHIGNFENWTDLQQYEDNFKQLIRALNTNKKQKKI